MVIKKRGICHLQNKPQKTKGNYWCGGVNVNGGCPITVSNLKPGQPDYHCKGCVYWEIPK